jgi:prophage maintenance system killer protein
VPSLDRTACRIEIHRRNGTVDRLYNHAFVDGNKRVASATMAIFVRLNGFALQATADDAEAFLIDEVIQARAPLARITTWIEGHLAPLAID